MKTGFASDLVVDDALLHGDMLKPVPTIPKGGGVREASKWRDHRRIRLPASNGTLLILRGKMG